jgi:hypothetical protein
MRTYFCANPKATFLNGGIKKDLKWQFEAPVIELRWQASPMLRVWDAIVSVDQTLKEILIVDEITGR